MLPKWEIKEWNAGGISVESEEGRICVVDINNGRRNSEMISLVPQMIEAILYYQDGIDHFYNCIDFGKSALDAKAIDFMNQSNIKLRNLYNVVSKLVKGMENANTTKG